MEEVTIKVNKATLFAVAGLIIGLGLGYLSGVYRTSVLAKNTNNPANQAVVQGNEVQAPSGNNQGAAAPPQVTLSKTDHRRGGSNAKVILVEYSDFQCPYCKNFQPSVSQSIKDYGNKIAWVYRHYPLSFHQNAQIAAEASECASEQGKFWEYSDLLFVKGSGDGTGLTPPELEQYAKDLGLNSANFESCLANKKYASRVNADFASGGAAGVTGTPATILLDKNGGTKLISGAVPYSELKTAIDAALAL